MTKLQSDSETEEHLRATDRDADAGKAFDLASEMEEPARTLDHLAAAIRLVGMDDEMPDMHKKAIYALADMLEMTAAVVEEKRAAIFRCTWSYRYGKRAA